MVSQLLILAGKFGMKDASEAAAGHQTMNSYERTAAAASPIDKLSSPLFRK